MNKTALKTIRDYDMLSYGDSVIAAVSGGADSMALLCFLLEIQKELDLSISVCHVNHLLRGEDAERDEQFVRAFCEKHAIPFYLKRCDVSALAKEKGIGFEECGRDVRYAFFNETAGSIGKITKIATAHNLGDCAETLIFNIARGASPAALSSIAPKRDNIIRPLIRCSREQIEGYLADLNQGFRTDKTNSDTAYSRNFIRHKVVPLLKEINPAFESAVLNLTELSREQQSFFSEICDEHYHKIYKNGVLLKDELSKLNIALRRSIIAAFCRENNVVVTKKLTDEVLDALSSESFCISVSDDRVLKCSGGSIEIKKPSKPQKRDFEYAFSLGEHALPDDRRLNIKAINYEEFENLKKNSTNLLKNCLCCDIIEDGFVIRNRRIGDEITLFPRNVTKTLKKLFNESKIEAEKRDIIPVLALGSRVLWAEGVGIDRSVAVKKDSSNIILIEVLEK
ncbi:MAG: tRNA lysidine(34) synthetase TilS [Oscillospiraceae bacterium]|nr:tRNA lysidine(34) synthetase TilS [Oscillospiraceae bacterium]